MQMAVAMGNKRRAGHCYCLPAAIQDGRWQPVRLALKSPRGAPPPACALACL